MQYRRSLASIAYLGTGGIRYFIGVKFCKGTSDPPSVFSALNISLFSGADLEARQVDSFNEQHSDRKSNNTRFGMLDVKRIPVRV